MMKSVGLGSHRPLSGQLYKYTNVVKGWQQRWFAVDPETGVLSYYLFDGPGDTVQPGQPARGEVIMFHNNLLITNNVLDFTYLLKGNEWF